MVENDGRKCARMDEIANNKTQQTHTYLFPLLLERMDNRNERTELFFCVVTRINCGKKRNLRKRNETKTKYCISFLSSSSLRSSLSSINLLISSPNFSSPEKNTFCFSFIFGFNFFSVSLFFSLLVSSLSLSKKKKEICVFTIVLGIGVEKKNVDVYARARETLDDDDDDRHGYVTADSDGHDRDEYGAGTRRGGAGEVVGTGTGAGGGKGESPPTEAYTICK